MSQSSPIERFRAFLADKGLRLTRQRQAIAEAFFDHGGHLSLPEVLDKARERHPSVGYTTVYRTMQVLAKCGLAVEHKFGEGNVRYEPSGADHHDHLICVDCGHVLEFEDDVIERRQEQFAEGQGFKVVAHRHVIYGECTRRACPERGRPQETVASNLRLPNAAGH